MCIKYFYQPLYAFDVGASLRCFQIYSVLRFNKFFQIQTRFIFYVAWGPMCIFGYCGHSSNFAFWALPFLFPTNYIVMENGADLNFRPCLLAEAVNFCSIELCHLLLKYGANPNSEFEIQVHDFLDRQKYNWLVEKKQHCMPLTGLNQGKK